MRKLLFAFIILISSVACSQTSTPFPSYGVNAANLTWEDYNVYSQIILAPWSYSADSADDLTGTSITNFTATNAIVLNPGFEAGGGTSGGYSGGGYFLGQIGTGPITDAEIIGSSNTGTQWQKFEIGMNIENTSTYPYITVINSFINAPSNPYNSVTNPGGYTVWSPTNLSGELDPYDPAQVMVEALFTNTGSGHTYTRYGFYQETVSVTNRLSTSTPAW